MNLRPLCTAIVWPTISGWMVERRDQVRTTFLSLVWFKTLIFVIRCSSINGPFLAERDIVKLLVLGTTNLVRSAETWCCPASIVADAPPGVGLFLPALHDEDVRALVVARLV